MKEIRATTVQSDDSLSVAGTPIIFDTPTTINDRLGSYTEIIKRSALDGVDLSDVKLLYNHDMNRLPLARSPKTMTFNVDDKGLNVRAELPGTEEGKSVHTSIKRGDLTGMSFGFTVADEIYDKATNTRTITKIDKILEVSITPFPAYESTTIEARSKYQEESINDLKIKLNKILFKGDVD